MTDAAIINLGLLLFIACVVAIAAQRVGVPYVVALAATGLALGLAGLSGPVALSRGLIFSVLLPPLVFEGALHLEWGQFRREAPLVLSLALIGTLLAAAVVAAGMHGLLGWGWQASALFGALIAATDPVSVLAMMKAQNTDPRLRFVMEAESMVNDGVAAVLFALIVAWIAGDSGTVGEGAWQVVTIAGGGILCGLLVASGLLFLAGPSDDPLVETALTVLAAYGSFLLAERLHGSGVLATLAAGMLVGNWGRGVWISRHGSNAMIRVWAFFAFLTNSVVFLLIGSRAAAQAIGGNLRMAGIAIALVLAGRIVAIYPLAMLFDRGALALSPLARRILVWGGLRGALALALALSAPAALPERDSLISLAFAVVAFSIFVQGLTVPRMLRAARAASE